MDSESKQADLEAKLVAMTDRQLFRDWRRYSEDEFRLVRAEVDARARATDFGRKHDRRKPSEKP